jgi:hypothetical protein
MQLNSQPQASAALPIREQPPVPFGQVAGRSPENVWLHYGRIELCSLTSCKQVTKLVELFWLHFIIIIIIVNAPTIIIHMVKKMLLDFPDFSRRENTLRQWHEHYFQSETIPLLYKFDENRDTCLILNEARVN